MKRPSTEETVSGLAGLSKRRKMSNESDDEDSMRTPIANQNSSSTNIYNSACRKERPDELFRKDLISQMKIPDSTQIEEADCFQLYDGWKPEWERGVQVPINPWDKLPLPKIKPVKDRIVNTFKIPKKYMVTSEVKYFSQDIHVLTDTAARVEKVCKYDLDAYDIKWLEIKNEERQYVGLPVIEEETMEQCLESFEIQCKNCLDDILQTEEGLGIEYDEDVNCDVCRAPDCEEGNEMVFCDSCNICVHQACYGITAIPEGSWICKPCTYNVKPVCVLCPNLGGAMKSTLNGNKWAHVNCALWVPEVSIGCPEQMEPVTKLSNIPPSRWNLVCSVCKERSGACIQCSVKRCKTAYHVTCAFESGFSMEMKTTAIDSVDEGVRMQSFCSKHCEGKPKKGSPSKPVTKSSPKKSPLKKKESKKEEGKMDEKKDRLQRIQLLEAKFYQFVNKKTTASTLSIETDIVDFLYSYWVLRRKANFNKPLLISDCVTDEKEKENLLKQHGGDILYNCLKMFVHIRQDLERVRNLCYMVSKREKTFRSFMRSKRDVLDKQIEILTNKSFKLAPKDSKEVVKACYGPNLLERYFCGDPEAEGPTDNPSQAKPSNPYAKNYVNNVQTRFRRHTTPQTQSDSIIENFSSESNDMPVLVDCQMEETRNLGDRYDKRGPPTFVNSRLEDDSETRPLRKQRTQSTEDGVQKHNNLLAVHEPEMPKIVSETSRVRRHSATSGTSSDKNLQCHSDKENINNSLVSIKMRKTRSGNEGKICSGLQELVQPKIEALEVETGSDNLELKTNFMNGSARYPTRSRRSSSDVVLNGTQLLHSVIEPSYRPPSPKSESAIDAINMFCSGNSSASPLTYSHFSPSNSQPQTPKRGRGRPRKIKFEEISPQETSPQSSERSEMALPVVSFSPIKHEVMENAGNAIPSDVLPDTLGITMSLRHPREMDIPKKRRGRKPKIHPIQIKLKELDASPLSESNTSLECSRTSYEEDNCPMSTPSSPERIVIRLKKETNGETLSSRSFRIIRDEVQVKFENSMSDFPAVIKYNNGFLGQHRYPMRDRAVLLRSAKPFMDPR